MENDERSGVSGQPPTIEFLSKEIDELKKEIKRLERKIEDAKPFRHDVINCGPA